jgi:PAS domain S-box-containing protein
VLDVHLPDIDGLELCQLLHERDDTAHIPIVHLSAAYVSDEDKVRGLDSGADAYLTHPVDAAVLVATVQAVVRTHMAEEAMRRSEAKFRTVYANAPSGICLLDADSRFLDANPAMLSMLHRSLDELVGRRLGEFAATRDAALLPPSKAGRRAGEAQQLDLVDGLGAVVPLEWHLSSHSDGVTLAQVIDISARLDEERRKQMAIDRERDARTSAEQLNRMKDEFIAVLSHELRSPLNAIMGWTHVLLSRGANEQTLDGLRAIERNGRAQARLISDLLDMSRLNVGKMRLARSPADPLEIVEAAVNSLDSASEEHDNPITVHAGADLPPIFGDSARLQQVMWNLLSNAVKFSAPHSPIDVVVARDGEGVRIAVRDHGRGIAPEFLPHLFERFTQADSANERFRSGLGLGLSIVSHLVQAHGGRVSATSDGLGLGSTFEVWLPAGTTQEAVSGFGVLDDGQQAAPSDALLAGRRLLLIDDDPEALAMLQIILSDRGAQVACATGYDEALTVIDGERPDLIVCDIGLPGRDGYQLIQEIRRREGPGSRVPAIALTAFSQFKDREQAQVAGFDAHLTKPARPMHLVRTIALLVSGEGGASGVDGDE